MSRRLLHALLWPALRMFVAGGLFGYGLAQPAGGVTLWTLVGVFWLCVEGVRISCRYRRRKARRESAHTTVGEALATAQSRFEAIIDGMPAAVFVADLRQDEILFANRSFTQMLGEDIIGRNAGSLLWPQLQGERHTFDAARIEAGDLPVELFSGEVQHPLTERWYVAHERAVRWTDGRVVRLAVLSDGDVELAGGQRSGLHADALGERAFRQLEVVVTHELDRETGGNAQLGLLDGELLKAQNRHRLEQDLLRPDGLDRVRQLGIGARVGGGCGGETASSGDTRSHGVVLLER